MYWPPPALNDGFEVEPIHSLNLHHSFKLRKLLYVIKTRFRINCHIKLSMKFKKL